MMFYDVLNFILDIFCFMKAVLKNYDCFISLGYDAAPLMDYIFFPV